MIRRYDTYVERNHSEDEGYCASEESPDGVYVFYDDHLAEIEAIAAWVESHAVDGQAERLAYGIRNGLYQPQPTEEK